ncbi:MAG: tol-pal system protein YbgF [Zoogloeaceae bacterium]|jgi:tol-pal system protein YbgF|nr:tol-pal system protein YbgF [Zoogloeaceae bacterium]
MSRLFLPCCLAALLAMPVARAGLFDDSGAREQIAALKQETEQKIDTLSKAQLELATQILGLREEISRLRGDIETLKYENEQAKKRQNDLYLDLDSRLSRFEGRSGGGVSSSGGERPPAVANTEAESAAYEDALNQFKAGKYKEAAKSLAAFVQDYPASEMAPNAQFWLGNAWYAQNKCKEAIDAQLALTTNWPDSPRAPDAMLAVANCQRDWGNAAAARRTLSNLVEKYPDSQAAVQAKQRLATR